MNNRIPRYTLHISQDPLSTTEQYLPQQQTDEYFFKSLGKEHLNFSEIQELVDWQIVIDLEEASPYLITENLEKKFDGNFIIFRDRYHKKNCALKKSSAGYYRDLIIANDKQKLIDKIYKSWQSAK